MLRPAAQAFDIALHQQTFTLRANDGFVEAFGPHLIARLSHLAPDVRLRFAPKPSKTDRPLREGDADLEIGVPGDMGPEIKQQRLFQDRFVGVVRRGHPLAGASDVTAAQFVAWAHVVASRRGVLTGPVDEGLAARGLKRHIAAVVPGFPAALAVARGTEFIALVPASFLINLPPEPGIVWFELPVPTRPIAVSQMWHPRLDADPAHRWLRQFMLAECRTLMPKG
ncbi:Transcriptional regulator, LysR family [Cronobacter condimenti 1330]|uniref:Transcriptional regulator, LysR family n=1 Tax=Cronobacter condimenti 1330 TaxID=1073999 RepID=K8A2M3_9ENTR|nr:Transcriptional regulator, LysR family [Cronobacter condimenti 1330]